MPHVEPRLSGTASSVLNVLTSNPRALGFWQRLGYQREESVRGAGLGRAWALSKELDVPNGT